MLNKNITNEIPNVNLLTYNNNFTDITNYLVAQYKFNDLTDSIGSYHLTNYNTTIYNGIISFTNTGQYLTIPTTLNPYNIWNGNGITFSLWFNGSTSSGSYARLFDFSDGGGSTVPNYILISKYSSSNNLTFQIRINTVSVLYTTPLNYFDNNWHHVVWTISSSGVWSIYVDNVSLNPATTQVIPNATWTSQYIGKSNWSGDGSYIGSMDDFRIYNTVLSTSDIANIYYSAIYSMDNVQNNLITYYKFDDITDSNGKNHLTNYGTTIFGGITTFTNTGQYLTIPTTLNPYNIWNGNGITFSLWFNGSTSSGNWARLFDFCKMDGGTSSTVFLVICKYNTANTLFFQIRTSSTNATDFTTLLNYFDNNWHHIVWTISSSGVWNIYVDNISLNPGKTAVIPSDVWARQYIGKSGNSGDGSFIGSMDDFRIYNSVLTADQVNIIYSYYSKNIQRNYNNNLVAYYKFNDNLDSIGNNHFVNYNCIFNYGYLSILTAGNYISFPSGLNLYNICNNNGLTISFWFRGNPSNSGTWARVFDFSDGIDGSSPTNSIFIAKNNSGANLRFCIMTSSVQVVYDTGNNYIDNNWHHIVWTITSLGIWIIYLDNIKYIPPVTSTIPNMTWSRQFIGYKLYTVDGSIVGDYDDLRFYNIVLTSDNVNNLYYNYLNSNNTLSNEQYLTLLFGKQVSMKDIKVYNRTLTNNEIMQLINTNNNIKTLTNEKQYPPNKWNYIYANTFTITNATYGLGNYTVATNSDTSATNCFDYSYNTDAVNNYFISPLNIYDASGVYITAKGGNLDGSYYGHWITIKLPYPIKLTKYRIISRYRADGSNNYILRSPGEYKIYGSNNGFSWTEITQASQSTRLTTSNYINNIYEKQLSTYSNYYQYYGLVVNKLVTSSTEGTLNIGEWQIFGDETGNSILNGLTAWYNFDTSSNYLLDSELVERQYPPRKYDSVSGSNPYTMVVTNATYGNGNYITTHKTLYGAGFEAYNLFNYDAVNESKSTYYSTATYDSTGVYVASNGGTLDNTYYGEYILLQLPYAIRLTRFKIFIRNGINNAYIYRSAGEFKIYGSNDGTTWTEIPQASQMTRLTNTDYLGKDLYYFEKVLANPSNLYQYFGIVVNKVVTTTNATEYLNLGEWQIFGVEDTTLINNGATYNANKYLTFGSGNYVTIPTKLNPYYIWLNNGITFSLWFRGDNATSGTWGRLFDFSNNTDGNNPTSSIMISVKTTPNSIIKGIYIYIDNVFWSDNTIYLDNNWHHIVWSISTSGAWTIYIDNININVNITKQIPNVAWARQYISKSAFAVDGNFIGDFKDFRIYNRVIKPNEISTLYYTNVSNKIGGIGVGSNNGPMDSLVCWYEFNNEKDSTINNKHLTPYFSSSTATTTNIYRYNATNKVSQMNSISNTLYDNITTFYLDNNNYYKIYFNNDTTPIFSGHILISSLYSIDFTSIIGQIRFSNYDIFYLNTGLISWYKFENNINDSTANSNNLSIATGVYNYSTNSIRGKYCLSLSETTTTPHNVLSLPSINLGQYNSFTFSFWLYPTSTNLLTKNTAVFDFSSTADGTGANRIYVSNEGNNKLNLNVQVSGTLTRQIINYTWALNTWTHFVWVINNSTWVLYINGILFETYIGVQLPSSILLYNTLGCYCNYGTSTQITFAGLYDDFRIYNRALTAYEIEQIFITDNSYLYTLDNRLLALYTFNNTILDNTSNGNNLSVAVGSYTFSNICIRGKYSLSLAATTTTPHNVLSIPTMNLGQYDSFTFAIWLYPTATNLASKNTAVFDFSNSTSVNTARITLCNQANNSLCLQAYNNTTLTSVTTNYSWVLNTWTHFTWVVNNSATANRWELYINGVLYGTYNGVQIPSMDLSCNRIGNYNYNGDASGNNITFSGLYDDFRIYNTALNIVEISQLYSTYIDINKSYPVIDTSNNDLVAWYKFDNSSNLGLDSTGSYTLTPYSSPAIDTSDMIKGIGSVTFSGSNYFEIANTGVFSPDNFTISCWAKIVSSVDYQTIAQCRDGANGWKIYVTPNTSNSTIQVVIGNTGTYLVDLNYTFATNPAVWRHFVMSLSNKSGTATLYFYINGVLQNPSGNTITYVKSTTNKFRIGGVDTTSGTAGTTYNLGNGSKLDDFRFYNRILTINEIRQIYYGTLKIETYKAIAPLYDLTFNGQSFFEIANDGSFSPDLLSICTWIKNVSYSGYQVVASCNTNYTNGWSIYINNNNLEFWTGLNGNNITICSIPLNTWYYLVITLNKYTSKLVVYINGILINTYP